MQAIICIDKRDLSAYKRCVATQDVRKIAVKILYCRLQLSVYQSIGVALVAEYAKAIYFQESNPEVRNHGKIAFFRL